MKTLINQIQQTVYTTSFSLTPLAGIVPGKQHYGPVLACTVSQRDRRGAAFLKSFRRVARSALSTWGNQQSKNNQRFSFLFLLFVLLFQFTWDLPISLGFSTRTESQRCVEPPVSGLFLSLIWYGFYHIFPFLLFPFPTKTVSWGGHYQKCPMFPVTV